MPKNGYYTAKELAELSGLSLSSIMYQIKIGKMRAIRFGGDYVIRVREGDFFIQMQKIENQTIKNSNTNTLAMLIDQETIFYSLFIKILKDKYYYKILYTDNNQIVNATKLFTSIFDWKTDPDGSIIFEIPRKELLANFITVNVRNILGQDESFKLKLQEIGDEFRSY